MPFIFFLQAVHQMIRPENIVTCRVQFPFITVNNLKFGKTHTVMSPTNSFFSNTLYYHVNFGNPNFVKKTKVFVFTADMGTPRSGIESTWHSSCRMRF
jgi:hypothetical protein